MQLTLHFCHWNVQIPTSSCELMYILVTLKSTCQTRYHFLRKLLTSVTSSTFGSAFTFPTLKDTYYIPPSMLGEPGGFLSQHFLHLDCIIRHCTNRKSSAVALIDASVHVHSANNCQVIWVPSHLSCVKSLIVCSVADLFYDYFQALQIKGKRPHNPLLDPRSLRSCFLELASHANIKVRVPVIDLCCCINLSPITTLFFHAP